MNCLVDLVRDERAMLDALTIFINKEQLKVYGVIWLILFLIQWMFKKIFFKKNWGLLTRFTMSLLVGVIFTTISLGIFYRLFKDELTPTVQIIGKHFRI